MTYLMDLADMSSIHPPPLKRVQKIRVLPRRAPDQHLQPAVAHPQRQLQPVPPDELDVTARTCRYFRHSSPTVHATDSSCPSISITVVTKVPFIRLT